MAHHSDVHTPGSPAKAEGGTHETPTHRARSPFSPSTVHKIPDPTSSQAYHIESPQTFGATGTSFRPDASTTDGPNSWNVKVRVRGIPIVYNLRHVPHQLRGR
eukprot:996178-Rhodomonas_salina.2